MSPRRVAFESPEMKIDASLMFDPGKVAAMAGELERAGFDGAYTFEGQSDPLVSLAAAAMSTERMALMTAIAVAFARNPMNLAYLGNDLQTLSKGRFILGLGTQVKAHIEKRFNMPWSKPVQRMREMVLAIRAIWHSWRTGERLKFEGEFYRHTLMSPVFSSPPNAYGEAPIFVAGIGPAMTEVAGEVGDGYLVHPFNSPRSLADLSLKAVERGLVRAGKRREGFQIAAQAITATGLNEQSLQQAVFAARSQIAFYASTPAYLPVLQCHGWEDFQPKASQLAAQGKWADMAGLVDDEMLHAFAVVGTPREVACKIAARYRGKVDRVSPVIYQPDARLLVALLQELRSALQ